MNSIFKSTRRDDALERLAIGITEAAKNCTTVVKKINTLCQDPERFPNPFELINEWTEYLFSNYFHDHIEEWTSLNIISIEQQEELSNAFFGYFASLTPFFFESKTVISPEIIRPKKYKWTADDYKELKLKLIYNWFYNEWDNWDGETRLKNGFKLESDTQKVVKLIAASSKTNASIWNKQKKIDTIVFSDNLMSTILNAMPSYKHQYQADLFKKYAEDFVKGLPTAFKKFDDNFYEVGTYLYKYFQWGNE